MTSYKRKDTLIVGKFYHYLMPTVLSTIAISLNEFVDSIIVSRLLGSNAMSMVNMGFPVMLTFAVLYTLLGVGGSVVYAEYEGKRESGKAARCFTLIFLLSIFVSVVVLILGLAFLKQVAPALCNVESLLPEFVPYLKYLFISCVLIVPLQVLITFFPAFGHPSIGTTINITANGVNLLLDYVFIRYFSTGLKGAAMATLTGYMCGALLVAVLMIFKTVQLPFAKIVVRELVNIPDMLSRGAAPALNQFGYCIKIYFCNTIAGKYAGIDGITVFALCMQVVSIVSVMICGIVAAMTPIAAALRGGRDFKGLRRLMKTVFRTQFVANLVIVIILEAFPQLILALYDVDKSLTVMAITGLRIFSIMFIFRGFVFVFMYYFQIISRKVYAILLSVIDGFAGLIPLILIFTSFMGINGLWTAFPVLSFLMLVGILITNLVIAKHSKGRYSGLLLAENEDPNVAAYDVTIPLKAADIGINTENLQEFCLGNNLGKYISAVVAMASEEIGMFILEENGAAEEKGMSTFGKSKVSEHDMLDLLVKVFPEQVVMDVRSIGKPFDPLSEPKEEFSNIEVLKKIASSIDFGYVVGMNSTRIKINY